MGNAVQLENTFLNFDVTTYGNVEKITDTLSKCRVRIFYKGLNRNRTYITEDFAQQLIASLPYAPIKGIFSYSDVDFEDHGEDNTDGRIYGVVPENPNFAWEKHLDEDGVEREYATADVYLFTGLYPEASLVPGKPQSMEIFKDTFQGEWRIWEQDGKPYFLFLKGSLVGLQTLGKNVEPCFEGAAFYSLYKEFQNCLEYINNNRKKEEDKMDKTIFRLSDDEKWELLFDALNPECNEEGGWKCSYYILSVYDDYALCYDRDNKQHTRVYYTKNDNSVTIGEKVTVYIVDVTESEYSALEAMKAIGGTYEATNDKFTEMNENISSLNAKVEECTTKIEEYTQTIESNSATIADYEKTVAEKDATIAEKETAIAEYSNTIETLKSEKVELETEKNDIINEKNQLEEFKLNVEREKKTAIVDEFSTYLTDEQIDSYKENMDNYTVSDFKKEVCTAAYEADPTIFSNKEQGLIYKGTDTNKFESGAIRLLNKYKNGGNK